jgi:N-acyl-D-aspartate/D-glutamate deacylase
MADFDIQIKGSTIVDGTRVPRYRGDVWIKDGKVAQLGGRAPGFAKKVIDASGLIVAPGFVDLHTHYDAQIRWDPYCTISGWHGVTSLVLGNCGLGFAPCKLDFRDHDAHGGNPIRFDESWHELGLGDHSPVHGFARPHP